MPISAAAGPTAPATQYCDRGRRLIRKAHPHRAFQRAGLTGMTPVSSARLKVFQREPDAVVGVVLAIWLVWGASSDNPGVLLINAKWVLEGFSSGGGVGRAVRRPR